LVDDEAEVRTFFRCILETDGLECGEAANGLLALEAVRSKPYDLAILDIDMEGMKGPELLKRLRANPPCPHFKILMVSGHATSNAMAEMMLAGADDYLSKPLNFVE